MYAVGGIGTGSVMEGKVSLEIVCRDLQRMIREEARSAALAGKVYRGGVVGGRVRVKREIERVREGVCVCACVCEREREWKKIARERKREER